MEAKRVLTALAGAILLCSGLAGCGSAKSSSGASSGAGKTLTVLVQANSIYPQQQRQWFADTAAKFTKDTGAKVTFETFASS
jgi:multiple sugar transport system substrate-binding protein